VIRIGAAVVGLIGVTLLVLHAPGSIDSVGLAAAFGSVLVSATGFVLIKRWEPPTDMITLVSWQLVVAGLVLTPVALLVEGPPPPIDLPAVLGFTWIAGVGTGVAYVCWFRGLRAMPAGMVLVAVGVLAGQPVVARLISARLRGAKTTPTESPARC
jgi:probable blue pigment (indigoidine) exporter